jgi:transposase
MPHLSDKARIVSHLENGRPITNLAAEFGVGKSSIYRIKNKWEIERSVRRKAGSGRPKASNEQQDEELLNFLRERPMSNAVEAIHQTNFPASRSTACRRIRSSELGNYWAVKKPFLTNLHKEQRVGFALEFLQEENFWNAVVFSDEKTFKSHKDGRVQVYRPRNTRFEENYTQQVNPNRFSVNVWGCISVRGPGVLCVVEQRLNANVYVNILEQVMLPFVAQAFPDNFTFQQDNCPIHTSAIAQNWFRDNDINVLPWPSRSPDINPIENIWGIMMNSMRRRNIRPQNRQDLINAINVDWHNLTPEFCQHLISSMSRRLNSVIEKNGAAIKY